MDDGKSTRFHKSTLRSVHTRILERFFLMFGTIVHFVKPCLSKTQEHIGFRVWATFLYCLTIVRQQIDRSQTDNFQAIPSENPEQFALQLMYQSVEAK